LQDDRAATINLLDLVCDVSFELTSDFKFKEDGPKIAALMTLGSSTHTGGLPFTSYMADDEDKAKFERTLSEGARGSGSSTGLQHVKLRDSLGNDIAMEVFHVRGEHLGTERYLVGLREEIDGTHRGAQDALPRSPSKGAAAGSRAAEQARMIPRAATRMVSAARYLAMRSW
jgi:hypothetical protein